MNKKVNIKKFLLKFTQNNLLKQLFEMHNEKIKGVDGKNKNKFIVPSILDTKNAAENGKVSEGWYEFYKSLELEDRESINESIEQINTLCNKDAHTVCKEFISKVAPTANEVMAFSFHDRALAFYIRPVRK